LCNKTDDDDDLIAVCDYRWVFVPKKTDPFIHFEVTKKLQTSFQKLQRNKESCYKYRWPRLESDGRHWRHQLWGPGARAPLELAHVHQFGNLYLRTTLFHIYFNG